MAYTSIYDASDVAPVATDWVVAVFVGIATFAFVIGAGFAIVLITKHLPFFNFK